MAILMGQPYYTRRNSLRHPDYDYAQAGAYFVTICTHQQSHYFGTIHNDKMHVNTWGNIAHDIWLKIPQHFSSVKIDTHIIMPNHMHGIVILTEDGKIKFGTVVGSYKSAVSKHINVAHNPEKHIIWQRGFYDHIVQHEREYQNIQKYIMANPARWREDRFYTGG